MLYKFQLWKCSSLDAEGNTEHPLLIQEAKHETSLLYYAHYQGLSDQEHYIVKRICDDVQALKWKWDPSYKMKYLFEFEEWTIILRGEIITKRFIIEEKSDTSVGLFGSTYTLDGDFHFFEPQELEEFRDKLSAAFECACGAPTSIMTLEEQERAIMMEESHMTAKQDDMNNATATPAKEIIQKNDGLMKKAHEHLEHKLHHISTGRADISILDDVRVEAYTSMSPLHQISSVSVPDARTITIQPWDKTLIPAIEKAIIAENLGFNPTNNGVMVIISVPAPTEERRKELIKLVHKEVEHARVSLRNLRHHGMDDIKAQGMPEDLQKDAEKELDNLTASWNKRVESIGQEKEAQIMKV